MRSQRETVTPLWLVREVLAALRVPQPGVVREVRRASTSVGSVLRLTAVAVVVCMATVHLAVTAVLARAREVPRTSTTVPVEQRAMDVAFTIGVVAEVAVLVALARLRAG